MKSQYFFNDDMNRKRSGNKVSKFRCEPLPFCELTLCQKDNNFPKVIDNTSVTFLKLSAKASEQNHRLCVFIVDFERFASANRTT